MLRRERSKKRPLCTKIVHSPLIYTSIQYPPSRQVAVLALLGVVCLYQSGDTSALRAPAGYAAGVVPLAPAPAVRAGTVCPVSMGRKGEDGPGEKSCNAC